MLHPRNPHVPTVHANCRFIQQGGKAWFGGGADLTPYYLYEEDAAHFHRGSARPLRPARRRRTTRASRTTCDGYFCLRHRDEARGVGGIFFENIGRPLEQRVRLRAGLRTGLPPRLPAHRASGGKDLPYTPEQRRWRRCRRGRYVEFNLV